MKKILRNQMSRPLQSVVVRLSLVAVALALVASSGVRTAAAQSDKEIAKQLSSEGIDDMLLNEWLEAQPRVEDITLPKAELEIYRIMPGATSFGKEEEIVFLVGAHNLGKGTAAFDYAVRIKGTQRDRWTDNGVVLSGGERHFTGFILPAYEVATEYSRVSRKTGLHSVCFTFSLLGRGSSDLFKDQNMINHQNDYCVEIYILDR